MKVKRRTEDDIPVRYFMNSHFCKVMYNIVYPFDTIKGKSYGLVCKD